MELFTDMVVMCLRVLLCLLSRGELPLLTRTNSVFLHINLELAFPVIILQLNITILHFYDESDTDVCSCYEKISMFGS